MGEYKEPQCVEAAPRNLLKADIPAGCTDSLLGELPASVLAEEREFTEFLRRSVAVKGCRIHVMFVRTMNFAGPTKYCKP